MDFHVAVPGPFTYLVHEHARSIVAIQELQQEVTSLLEFRSHVLEALPHLHSRPFHSLTPTPSHDTPHPPRSPHNPPPHHTSPAKASPHLSSGEGGRGARVVGVGGGNSSSGGKSLSETQSNSAVADSGFSTDKAGASMGKSSSSSAGEHLSGAEDPRWTPVDPQDTSPLGSAEDELWHLLDVIHRKGTRLRHDLERAERVERDRLTTHTPTMPQHLPQNLPQHPAPASDPLSYPRPNVMPSTRDFWPHSLPGPLPAGFLPPPPPPSTVGVALEAEAWAAVDRLRQERQYLVGRVGWAEAEAATAHQRLVDLHTQLVGLAGDKRRLEDHLRALALDPQQPQPTPVTPTTQGGNSPVTILTDTTSGGPQNPLNTSKTRGSSSVRVNTDREVILPRVLKVPIKDKTPRPTSNPQQAPPPRVSSEEDGGRGSDRVVIERERRPGKADGGLSMPVSLLKGTRLKVTPNKQRISAILREKDVLELQRQLLTTVMETEVLKKQIESAGEEWATKAAEWESEHRHALSTLTALKDENAKLRKQAEGAKGPELERREVGVMASPPLCSTSTMTGDPGGPGGGGEEDAPTHTVHSGPNVKYDVVVHEEKRAHAHAHAHHPRRTVEKPPRRPRDPRLTPTTTPSPDSLGKGGSGHRGRTTSHAPPPSSSTSSSGRITPTPPTPRSSPAPSITPRMCTSRPPQDSHALRPSPLTRNGAGRGGVGRRDSLKTGQTRGGAGQSVGGGVQSKTPPPPLPHQGALDHPRPLRHAPSRPRSPLSLADLRSPSPSPALKGVGGRKVGMVRRGVGGASSGAVRGVLAASSSSPSSSPHQELRLSHLAPPTSPSPPPSPSPCSSDYYDSINASPSRPPGPPSPALMQVEVSFDWSPINRPRPDSPPPPDSLEGGGRRRGGGRGVSSSSERGRGGVRRAPPSQHPHLRRHHQDINTRVHQILSRMASGAP